MGKPSSFIKTAHPKKEVQINAQTFQRILDADWWGQTKIHGHRAQIHLSADSQENCLVYNRHGKLHAKELEGLIIDELRRILAPKKGWTVIEAEWLKNEQKLFLFDCIKLNDELLSTLTYEERYRFLPKLYISPHIVTLPVLRTVEECMAVINNPAAEIEGVIFKSRHTKGYSDHSLIRCRKIEARALK